MTLGLALLRADLWPLLLLVPVVWWGLGAAERARRRRLKLVLGPRADQLAAERGTRRRGLRRALVTASVAAAVTALLQPAWGARDADIEQRGVDVLVCLDVSRSMLARDASPDRLRAAHREVQALADRAVADRLGLVAFAGEARLLVPLTVETRAFQELVPLAEPGVVRRGGTDLGAALETALRALEGRSGDDAVVLLLTDGEDLGGRGLAVAERCAAQGIRVHCVGFGSARGAKIAVAGDDGAETYVRDGSGADVVSAMDPASLQRIAAATGGVFVAADAAPRPLVGLYEAQILSMARAHRDDAGSGSVRTLQNRFQGPLLLAFVLWLLASSLSDRSRGPRAGYQTNGSWSSSARPDNQR